MNEPELVTMNGIKIWMLNGEIHCVDEPAVVYPDGKEKWFIHDNDITKSVEKFMQECNVKSIADMDEEVQCLFWIMLGSI